MNAKTRVRRLEEKANGTNGRGRCFIVNAKPAANNPDVFNIEGGGVESRGIRERDISAEARKLAKAHGVDCDNPLHVIIIEVVKKRSEVN